MIDVGEAAHRTNGFRVERLGVIMEPDPADPREVEGVLNPAAARGPDGQLYLFPRLVARGNYSRIGRARVRFDAAGEPVGADRLGIALEPEADYEAQGCEDPRITFVEPLGRYVMTYTAFSVRGPRIALAVSRDLLRWERLGMARFDPYPDPDAPAGAVDFGDVPNKDGLLFPEAVHGPDGEPALALLHRPLFPETEPATIMRRPMLRPVDVPRESVWVSYAALEPCMTDTGALGHFRAHHQLVSPVAPWERVKVGGGAPPIPIAAGWLLLYHGVSGEPGDGGRPHRLTYAAGALVLDRHDPRIIRYRSREPILAPEVPEEREGVVANVVFPTGMDRRDDLGRPNPVDVYYGMADTRVGAARLELPATLPPHAVAHAHGGRV